MSTHTRNDFRRIVNEQQDGICIIPWCDESIQDAHHIIERELWDDGGYIPDNGAGVCGLHHKFAEENHIPPQAFWKWRTIDDPPLPDGISTTNVNKWGDELDYPPWKEHRERIKYPSTRHLPFSHVGDADDTYHRSVESFLGVPLVILEKMDGSNAMLMKDIDEPVRARNGREAEHDSFDLLKDLYWNENIHEKIPETVQVFGEWLYEKHSIHYGCDCNDSDCDVGKPLTANLRKSEPTDERAYFQIFGVYDMELDYWLSWPFTVEISQELGFPTAPVLLQAPNDDSPSYTRRNVFYNEIIDESESVVNRGGEGLVVRSKFPYHYGQFSERVGKYVRENHVKTDKHWSIQSNPRNKL